MGKNIRKAGVVCDSYKVEHFKKILTDAGFTYNVRRNHSVLKGTHTITIKFDVTTQMQLLKETVENCESSFKATKN